MYEYRIAKSKNGEYMLRNGIFLADRYEILEQIGTGGMSDVYIKQNAISLIGLSP